MVTVGGGGEHTGRVSQLFMIASFPEHMLHSSVFDDSGRWCCLWAIGVNATGGVSQPSQALYKVLGCLPMCCACRVPELFVVVLAVSMGQRRAG